jgi:hypothetical protein
MNRRWFGVTLISLLAFPAFSGCGWLHESLRPRNRAADAMETKLEEDSDSQRIGRVQSEPPQGFFNSSRLSGAMSDEGREVERSLGIK